MKSVRRIKPTVTDYFIAIQFNKAKENQYEKINFILCIMHSNNAGKIGMHRNNATIRFMQTRILYVGNQLHTMPRNRHINPWHHCIRHRPGL